MFHATLLRQYKETEVYGANFPKPPPELIEGEEVYEVENILKHRKRGRTYQYYVKWKKSPISEASWEPEEVLYSCCLLRLQSTKQVDDSQ